jgi:hypothetical protein
LVQAVQESGEQVGAVGLVVFSGVVVLGLQGGPEWMLAWKKMQVSQMASKAQSSSGGRVPQSGQGLLAGGRDSA